MTPDAGMLDRTDASATPGGLAGWLIGLVRDRKVARLRRELRLVEALPLGGHKQLVLVACGEERYLVGMGADSVQSIIRVGAGETCS